MFLTALLRWWFVVLTVYILFKCISSLFATRCTPEVWGTLKTAEGESLPITHWENIIGRTKSSDIKLSTDTISKTQALLIREKADKWLLKDTGSANGTYVNGKLVTSAEITEDDEIRMGDVIASVEPAARKFNPEKTISSPWYTVFAITIFQLLSIVQLSISTNRSLSAFFPILILTAVMWGYVLFFTAMNVHGFEMEMIAFFMSTINLTVVASSEPARLKTSLIAILIGIGLMIFMCLYMRDIKRMQKLKPVLIGLSVLAMIINFAFGTVKNGAGNWIDIGGTSFQPSEIVKVAFIFIGADTLDNLYNKRNTLVYAVFSLFCLGCLTVMSDFGTALIFLATYLVVSFLRSGDFSRMVLSGVAVCAMGFMVLKFKPYIAKRFAAWGHVWEPDFMNDTGFQQTRTMSYGAGGGLFGLGAGNGSLKNLEAANTDLVFGMVMEEWGLIVAVLLVMCIVAFAMFALINVMAGRSTFYTILSCGTATMLLIQTMLNVFGSVDILPLTGVTFPFVSAGGSSMLASWAMLAYFKVSDMRENASLAVRKEVS